MLSRHILKIKNWPVHTLSFRGVKGNRTEIVDSEIGTLHLSVNDDDHSARIKNGVKRGEIEDLNPYVSDIPEEGKRERSLNSVNLIGRVGNIPVMRGTQDKPVTVFSLATNTMWKSVDNQWSTRTDWHNIAVFKKGLREHAYNTVEKGQRLHIQGKILYGEVTDAAGIRRHTTTIAVDDIIFLASPKLK
ncbi:single-stranded DNA-binding protein, mitochondrial isoform X1 [Eurytemora carolleeae]|uniref:single-stranded DNA-binding protein, mitochondrial isoform X1 n=1 Tax=Eurytemora carolleeae TaxID=1294199 RepID=UPI000C771242|nr:single-stranded DNA-binding protein, mitochondrial isoform X1 [Eurytemora carolleeae]|eukprot:XP_023325428.1 single-stranded DNA-binding protein, mitochondrial-like isoform X1 [Eurytemora affinis]